MNAEHPELLIDAMRAAVGTPLWATYWDLYEGMCWLKAFASGLHISILDPDLNTISARIARYRIWTDTVEASKG